MPKPLKGEPQSDFISRAIKAFVKEGKSPTEAKGRAFGFWRYYSKKHQRPKGLMGGE